MNSKLILLFCLFFPLSGLKAADLLVQEFGPTGTFNSIGAAVSAAVDGDRIIISDRPGGPPWIENVTISKSLTLLPAVSGTRFSVLGDYTISPALSGKQVRIIGMDNGQGDIRALADAPIGNRSKVEIVGCRIDGQINFDYSYFDVTVASNEILGGGVTIRFGNVYGNDLLGYFISIEGDALAGNEEIRIMGNRAGSIQWSSSSHFMYISNNFIEKTSSSFSGLFVANLKDSGVKTQQILNNSFAIKAGGIGIDFVNIGVSNAQFQIFNNVFDRQTSSSVGAFSIPTGVAGAVDISYNFGDMGGVYLNSSGSLNNGTNGSSTIYALGANGTINANLIDLGHPSIAYYDHDLTRNNPGCYGGSYSMSNYYPQTTNPRVYNVFAPSVILQGNTFDVSAEGFDR